MTLSLCSAISLSFTFGVPAPLPAPRAPPPSLLLPAAPLAAATGLGLLTLISFQRAKVERDSFFSISWNQDSQDAEEDACVLIGEEAASDGKQWFVCTSDAQLDGADCTLVQGWGNAAAKDGEKLCKVPKASS